MFGLFKKKTAAATAVLREDGRARANELMAQPRYNTYRGAEPMLDLAATIELADGSTVDGTIRAPLMLCVLLLEGVRVAVALEPSKPAVATVNDTHAAVLARNPQLKRD